MTSLRAISRLITIALLTCAAAASQTPPATSSGVSQDKRLDKLTPALRERGLALLNERDEVKRADLAEELAETDGAGARDFLLAVLGSDPSPRVRREILDQLDIDPEVRRVLEHHAVADPDLGVALFALEKLRSLLTRDLRQLLLKRMDQAARTGNESDRRQLAEEHERWISLVRGTMLPAFLRVPPPVFSLSASDRPVRLLAFGDYGNGTPNQKRVANSMLKYHRKAPFDFAITLGDNFYSVGMESPTDPRWKTWWEELYEPLGIKYYVTLGNHDWGHPDSPAAELLYGQKSKSWQLPAPYYTFTAGPVQFFALDTNETSDAQLNWLASELAESRARWKLVYGHHPIYSAGAHRDSKVLIARLLPLLKERADIYLAGHDHDLQHLKPEGGLHFFVSGGGGANIRPLREDSRSLFAKMSYGFAVIEADVKRLTVRFIDPDLKQLYEYTISKDALGAGSNPG
jgi:hypothetical protein